MGWFENLLDEQVIEALFTLEAEMRTKLIGSLVIILLLWLLRLIAVQFIDHNIKNTRSRYSWRKTSAYIVAMIGVLLLARLWVPDLEAIATYLGLASAGLAIAMQGPLTDLAGWLFILSRRPFEVGDRVEIDNEAGDVVDIRIFQFTILEIGNWVHADQSTGRVMHIPNRKVFSHALANYNKGIEYIWHEIEVLITFESNWEKAKALLSEIANRDTAHLSQDAAERVKRAARRFYIVYHNLTPIVYLRVEGSGVLLTLRYLCDPRRRRSTEQAIWEDILREFSLHSDLEFAYPTQRFYHRQLEKKVPPPEEDVMKDGVEHFGQLNST